MLQTLPVQDGYHMPAEFAPQSGVLLVWPVRPGSWGIDPRAAQETFCAVMRAASRSAAAADAPAELRLAAKQVTLTDAAGGAAVEVLYRMVRDAENLA